MSNQERGDWNTLIEPGVTVDRPWYKKKRWLIPIGLVFCFGVIGQFSDGSTESVAIAPATAPNGTGAALAAVAPASSALSPGAAEEGAGEAGSADAADEAVDETTAAVAPAARRATAKPRAAATHRARSQAAAPQPKPKPKPQPVRAKPKPKPKPTKKPAGDCDSHYSGGCVPIDSDVDCAGGSGNGPSYFSGVAKVVGSDIYDLDRDGDGYACET